MKFLNRERELAILLGAINTTEGKPGAIVYGPRRAGKTRLIMEALKKAGRTSIYYECTTGTFAYNMELFSREAAAATGKSFLEGITDLYRIFDVLCEVIPVGLVAVFDEYPYLRETEKDGVVDSWFQRLIDRLEGKNITIILSGSHIAAMEELLATSSPLFGRFRAKVNVMPFDYLEAAAFYPSLPVRDKIAFYAVFGGYPYVLEALDERLSLKDNICAIELADNSPVRLTLENVILKECGKSGLPVETLSRIGNGRLRYSEIESLLTGRPEGTLDKALKTLIGMRIIEKKNPINRKNEKKKTFYEIRDNFMRFHFTYIQSRISRILSTEPEDFFDQIIQPSLNTFISYRFEALVREYFNLSSKADVEEIGTYWYDNPKEKKNGEFDCVLKLTGDRWKVFEAKYLSSPMGLALYEEEKAKMLSIPQIPTSSVGFVSSSGFAFDTSSMDGEFIDGEALYSVTPARRRALQSEKGE